jgi:hypothetical protein
MSRQTSSERFRSLAMALLDALTLAGSSRWIPYVGGTSTFVPPRACGGRVFTGDPHSKGEERERAQQEHHHGG